MPRVGAWAYKEIAKNAVGEVLMATSAILDGCTFRGQKNVIAIKL